MMFGPEDELLAEQFKRDIDRISRDAWKRQDLPVARVSRVWKALKRT